MNQPEPESKKRAAVNSGRVYLASYGKGNPTNQKTDVSAPRRKLPMRTTTLHISQIRRDGATQPRAFMDDDLAYEYFEALKAGDKFPPVTVFYDGSNYWLADGFHRCQALALLAVGGKEALDDSDCRQIECAEIQAEILQGTLEEAQWYSFSANKHHGQRRTQTDKQAAIKSALLHAFGREKSDHAIAKHVGCSQRWVTDVRQSLVSKNQLLDNPVRTATRKRHHVPDRHQQHRPAGRNGGA